MLKNLSVLIISILSFGAYSVAFVTVLKTKVPGGDSVLYQSEHLIVKKISPHVFQHISYLQTNSFGKVSCNGMVVVAQNEAIILDTPADSLSSEELLNFLIDQQKLTTKAVVATHFHEDCVGGLNAFHRRGIKSYASQKTIQLLKSSGNNQLLPQEGFRRKLTLPIAGDAVSVGFFGEGHTTDNVVVFYAPDRVLFGGCLVKETGASRGNLADANTKAWSKTVEKVKQAYPEVKVVIPGHGKAGGKELLDYTIGLFQGEH